MKAISILAVVFIAGFSMLAHAQDTITWASSQPQSRPSNVKSIVYVCDGSAGMAGNKADVLAIEINKAVNHLTLVQSFNILLFQKTDNGKGFLPLSDKLLMATPDNKQKSQDFVAKLKVQGAADPIPALVEGFKEHPSLLYLLVAASPDHPDIDTVGKKINALNADKKVHVNIILMLENKDDEPKYKDFEDGIKKITLRNGGIFVIAAADDN